MKQLESVKYESSPAIDKARKDCIFCGLCNAGCRFLAKYDIVIGDLEELERLKWSCFQCGRCTEVCPAGVDGMQAVWDMRSIESVRGSKLGTLARGGAFCLEKLRYPFKNYKHAKRSSFFPGCSFFSNFPVTTERIHNALAEKTEIGIVFDCCGSPVYELGLGDTTSRIVDRLSRRLSRHGVEEILTACPHCYELLQGNIPQKVRTVYEALEDCDLSSMQGISVKLFPPCPDRRSGQPMLKAIEHLMGEKHVLCDDVQCCGYGGNAANMESGLSEGMADEIAREDVVTYCASCANALGSRTSCAGEHILSLMMDADETADTGNSFMNRVRSKFLR